MGGDFVRLINRYLGLVDEADKIAWKIGKKIAYAVRRALGEDVEFDINCEPAMRKPHICIDAVDGRRHSIYARMMWGDRVWLLDLITEVFPELKEHITTKYGFYVREHEVEKVLEELRKLRKEK